MTKKIIIATSIISLLFSPQVLAESITITARVEPTPQNTEWLEGSIITSVTVIIPHAR